MNEILREAKRLYDMGAGVHWIKPRSKAPVKSGWSSPTRDDWPTVERDYQKGYGLGVRMGESSRLTGGGYLANIDVDIKSPEKRHLDEAFAFLESKFPGLAKQAPVVKTGHGFRFFIKTAEPLQSGKLGASSEECKVLLPTTEINRRQAEKLTAEELKAGYRIRGAWEVEFMSTGKQVVLPPSIHPDTGKPYLWKTPWLGADAVPLVDLNGYALGRGKGRPAGTRVIQNFKPVTVDLVGSNLSDRIVDMILHGDPDRLDRSAFLFSVCLAMVQAGMGDDEILTVLTDTAYPVGEVAYEHRATNSRAAAAAWVRDYTLKKARESVGAVAAFEAEVEVSPLLDDAEALAQESELVTFREDWSSRIKRTGKDGMGPPKPTVQNVVLILENAVSPELFRRDMFALRDTYGVNAPWPGGKKDKLLEDGDAVHIALWLAKNYGFEPNKSVVFDAMEAIASQNGFHPVRDELDALPPWDGTPRVDTWLRDNFKAKGPDEYLGQVFRKWLVASIARTYVPGTKFDWIILFEGNQGTGKSSFGSILFGESYFVDWLPNLNDKDAALGLQGTRCVEFGEMDQLRRSELETTKAFITRQVDKVRPPYGRKIIESRRQCVFFGTTNKSVYLRDDTGNRRFNPVEVGFLDFEALARDREQLWAEAKFIYDNCLEASYYLSGDAEAFSKDIQDSKLIQDESEFMVARLERFVEEQKKIIKKDRFNFEKFTAISLFNDMGPLASFAETMRNIQFANKALRAIGAEKRKIEGKYVWKLRV